MLFGRGNANTLSLVSYENRRKGNTQEITAPISQVIVQLLAALAWHITRVHKEVTVSDVYFEMKNETEQ